MAEIHEIREAIRKKQRKKLVRRIAVFVILASLAVIIFINKDSLTPEAISNWLSASIIRNTGEEGFPMSLPSGEIISLDGAGSDIVVTNQTNVYFYSQRGREIRSLQHQKKVVQTKTAGKNVLVYSVGGNEATVETATKTVATVKTVKPIVSGAISKNGEFALATESDVYTSELKVFDKNGNEIFKWIPSGGVISSIGISPDGNFVTASTLYSSGGELRSGIYLFSTSKSEAIISQQLDDEIVVSLYCKKNTVYAITDKQIIKVEPEGISAHYGFSERELINHSINDDDFVFVFRDVNDPGKSVLTTLNDKLELKSTAGVNAPVIASSANGNYVYLLSEKAVLKYEIDTAVKEGEAELSEDGQKIYVSSSGIFVVNEASQLENIDIK